MSSSMYSTRNWPTTESKRFALDCGVALSHALRGGSEQPKGIRAAGSGGGSW